MGTAIYAQSQASAAQEGEPGAGAGEAETPSDDDEVVEAEIVDEEKPRREEGGAA